MVSRWYKWKTFC